MKKNIFIIGSQGYNKNYGGWETFTTFLANYYPKDKANIYVSEITHDKHNLGPYKSNNINCDKIYIKTTSSLSMPLYTIKTLYYYISYIKKNNIKNCIFLILGLKVGPFLKILNKRFKKLNIKIYVNPDGLEWKRSKWNSLAKKYFKYAEKSMLKYCDGIVCDSLGIKSYLEEEYPNNKVPKYFIAYGASTVDISKTDENKILKKYKLKKYNYSLFVGRCVPENNIELIINEYKKSKINKDLIIISNIKNNKYFDILKEKTKYYEDKRIKFIPGVYDKEELTVIRKNAYLYLHGHSVGGTNPSLLEALSITDLNLLYDVNFNREVGKDACLYFTNKNDNLSSLLDKDLSKEKESLGKKAKKIIKENYTWDIITKKYVDLFEKSFK